MSSKFPSDLPIHVILNTLKTHALLMRQHPLVTKFGERPMTDADLASIQADQFSSGDRDPAQWKNTKRGVHFRVHASGGVVVWGDIKVGMSAADEYKGESASSDVEGMRNEVGRELVEECNVEVPAFMLPFVKYSMKGSNEQVCQGIIDLSH
ncbi:hypothetical protein F4805DRAFT_453081 [Annulohypoxylon moriforme]|nr:hypothetical protein F4805DRAFT_453081 [Annulohypoxylon moriforme]